MVFGKDQDMRGNKFRKGKKPWNKGNRAYNTNCKRCGIEIRDSVKRVYCSNLCWAKSVNVGRKRPDLTGENNYNWKGGISSLNDILRKQSKWKIWRELVFLRNNFICQNKDCKFCGNKIGVLIHPHHIKPVALFPELVFNVDNGITYCAEFHLKGGLHFNIQKNKLLGVN